MLQPSAVDGATPDEDYTAGSITIDFAIDQIEVIVPVEILGDLFIEGDEFVDLSFANFTDSGVEGLAQPTATLVITGMEVNLGTAIRDTHA